MHLLLFMHKQKYIESLLNKSALRTRLHMAPVFWYYKPNNEKARQNVIYRGAIEWNALTHALTHVSLRRHPSLRQRPSPLRRPSLQQRPSSQQRLSLQRNSDHRKAPKCFLFKSGTEPHVDMYYY